MKFVQILNKKEIHLQKIIYIFIYTIKFFNKTLYKQKKIKNLNIIKNRKLIFLLFILIKQNK